MTHYFTTDPIAYHANISPDRPATIDLASGRQRSYGDMHRRVGRIAALLQSRGVMAGDRVGYLAMNSSDILDIIYACWRIGAIGVAFNYRLDTVSLAAIAGQADPKLLFLDAAFAYLEPELSGACSDAECIEFDGMGDHTDFEALIADQNPVLTRVEQLLDAPAMLLFTSGSTGIPKGVIITHSMILCAVMNGAGVARSSQDSSALVVTPLSHVGTLCSICFPAFSIGAKLIIQRAFDAGETLSAIDDPELDVNYLSATPALYKALSEHRNCADTDFSRIETAISGGEKLPQQQLQWWIDRGLTIQEGYAMTEAASSATLIGIDEVESRAGSVGKPLHYVTMRIAGSGGQDVRPHETGEIWLKGPMITSGYWQNPQENDHKFIDDWYRTGDMGHCDESGFLYIDGRKDDAFVVEGEHILPAQVEAVIRELRAVKDVAVTVVPDGEHGSQVCAIVVLDGSHPLELDELVSYCSTRLPRRKCPKHLVFVDALPRSSGGKIDRALLGELLPERILHISHPAT